MERPRASSRQKPIRTLIADGAELQARLAVARQIPADNPARTEALRSAINPYLQLVDADIRDEYTGLLLRDIWRYFRYTWSIPQTPIPGRKILYLVRDAAHEAHPVIGIAALSNCAVQLLPRDRAIGPTAKRQPQPAPAQPPWRMRCKRLPATSSTTTKLCASASKLCPTTARRTRPKPSC